MTALTIIGIILGVFVAYTFMVGITSRFAYRYVLDDGCYGCSFEGGNNGCAGDHVFFAKAFGWIWPVSIPVAFVVASLYVIAREPIRFGYKAARVFIK